MGAMAGNAHGFRRNTENVDVLLTRDGLARFKERWLGSGWNERFPGSKGLVDAVADVRVHVLLAGEYPGDRQPKPVAFPDPAQVAELGTGDYAYPVLKLPVLIELEIASGLSASHRRGDLDDATRLIKVNKLPREYAEQLHPYVRPKFLELWEHAQIDEDY